MQFRVIGDTSNHGLPVGATVSPTDPPEWAGDEYDVQWYTQGGDGDEVAIEPVDLTPNPREFEEN